MISIKRGCIADAGKINELIYPLVEEFIVPEFSEDGRKYFLSTIVEESVVKKIESNGFQYYLATENEKMVGIIALKNENHVFNLFVPKSEQRRGIAKILWEHAKCESLRNKSISLFTVNASSYSIPVYERLGFKIVGKKNDYMGILSTPMEYTIS